MKSINNNNIIVTAGSTYLDIDAYACMVAMKELLTIKGINAIAYSEAPLNYSIVGSLTQERQIERTLPVDYRRDTSKYIIVDVSDTEYIKKDVPLDNVVAVYDHHTGFEKYWEDRIGDASHIEFIGAAATLVYIEWKKAKLIDKMPRSIALLLVAAILDNTLNLTSSNTTSADVEALKELCKKENIGEEWYASYFAGVQDNIKADLKNALFKDIKTVQNNNVLPDKVAQLCIWDATDILEKLPTIRQWMYSNFDSWMINIIDIKHRASFFVCDSSCHQKKIARAFNIVFENNVAKTRVPYLRKEIIKKTQSRN